MSQILTKYIANFWKSQFANWLASAGFNPRPKLSIRPMSAAEGIWGWPADDVNVWPALLPCCCCCCCCCKCCCWCCCWAATAAATAVCNCDALVVVMLVDTDCGWVCIPPTVIDVAPAPTFPGVTNACNYTIRNGFGCLLVAKSRIFIYCTNIVGRFGRNYSKKNYFQTEK